MIFIFIGTLVAVCFGIALLSGAPYLPTYKSDAADLLSRCQLKTGAVLVDLGSGDGKVLRAAAAQGLQAIGYEINPIMWLISQIKLWPYRKMAKAHLGDMWQADISRADVVFVFLLDRLMGRLEAKLRAEAKPGTLVVSYVFKLPGKKPLQKTHNAYIYKF